MGGKLKASLFLTAMFGLGFVAGLAWQSYRFQHRMLHPLYVSRRIHRLQKELHLNTEQEVAIRQIFEKAHERARQVNEEVSWDLADIHRDSVQAIRQVLTPEQQQEFERLHRRAHAHSHRPMEEMDEPASGNRPAENATAKATTS